MKTLALVLLASLTFGCASPDPYAMYEGAPTCWEEGCHCPRFRIGSGPICGACAHQHT